MPGNTESGKHPRDSTRPGSPQRVGAAEHSRVALDMRISGKSYRAIGEALGISQQAAWALIDRELVRVREECAEKRAIVIEMEVARLDRMTEKLDPGVEIGDPDAIRTMLAVQARRSKLLGLDAPTQINVTQDAPDLFAMPSDKLESLARGGDLSKLS